MLKSIAQILVIAPLLATTPAILASEQAVSPAILPFPTSFPLPSLKTIMERTVERAKLEEQNDRGFQQHYTFRRIRVNEEWNGPDSAKKREEKISQHTPKIGVAAPIVIKSVPSTPNPPATSTKSLSKKDFAINEELLARFQFTMLGREVLNGRPALVLDFKPAGKNFPIHSFKDHFINKAAGRLWVDEDDFVLAKTDIRLTEGVSILGGLLGAVKGLSYHFDRERTPDGFWFTKKLKWHVDAREFLVNKTMEHQEEKLDVRKVN